MTLDDSVNDFFASVRLPLTPTSASRTPPLLTSEDEEEARMLNTPLSGEEMKHALSLPSPPPPSHWNSRVPLPSSSSTPCSSPLLQTVRSFDSNSSTVTSREEIMMEETPAAFFVPRRRYTDLAVPEAVTISYSDGNEWFDESDEEELVNIQTSTIPALGGWKERWRLFLFPPPPSRSSLHRKPPRRNLLLGLFLIALYTTFGLASPHLRRRNLPTEVPAELEEPAETLTVVAPPRPALRGTAQQGHLSFARGAPPRRPLYYRRRQEEMQDFLHQSAVLRVEEAASSAWYFNCLVLLAVALFWGLRREKATARRG